MPSRKFPIVTDEIYHVFNRGIDKRPTFTDKREYERTMQIIKFYRFSLPPVKLSRYLSMTLADQTRVTRDVAKRNEKLVTSSTG